MPAVFIRYWNAASHIHDAGVPAAVTKYRERISGPVLDRIDTAQPH